MINFSSDKPISQEVDDRFQRYNFSKRIARTIINRDNDDSIVIGIYGAWGEGKTSVINFIETELKIEKNIIVIKFNPWRYKDENTLLIQFFQKLAISLNANLKTGKEKLGDILKKYGKLLSIDIPMLGSPGDTLETIGEMLADVDIETLKERIEGILKDADCKVVIFIDDIDRLEKTEIHSVFRLVKLTADFINTTYILSFDENMVSAAIGDRFGAGNQEAGQNFLEKIIQVPIKLPVAQPEALKLFCFELIDEVINTNQIVLIDEEKRRFVREFVSNILQKLDTPRLAIRYGNTLSFSLPLLYGEVNSVDLMLIEAIKIFYPNHYEFIKTNPDYFLLSYENDKDKINAIKQDLENLSKSLTKAQKNNIQDLLIELFPILKGAFSSIRFHNSSFEKWFKDKRIVSTKYFNRYFTYSVIKGEISDIAFQSFISGISSKTLEEISDEMITLINQSSPSNFLYKIRNIEENFDWNCSTKISTVIVKNSKLFPQRKGFSFGFDDDNGQAGIFIYQLLKQHENKLERYDFAKSLMILAQPFQFAYDLNNWFRSGETVEEKIFSETQSIELAMILVNRAKIEAGELLIFEKFPDDIVYLFKDWADYDKNELQEYIKTALIIDPTKCAKLLTVFIPNRYSTAVEGPYKTDLTEDLYQYIVSILDKEVINTAIDKSYSEAVINENDVFWLGRREHSQTPINIIRQYKYWYNKSKTEGSI